MSYREEIIGGARLILGDCREVLGGLSGISAVVTDPPYGITYQSNHSVGQGTRPITNDGTRVSLRLYRSVIPLLPDAIPVLWFTRWDAWPDVWEVFAPHKKINGVLIWDKGTPGMGDLSHWGCSYEMIVSAGDVKLRGGRDNSVVRFNGVPSNNRNHPTEKPAALFQYLIEKVTDGGATICDPFMGSGTCGVAATEAARKFVGIECDAQYFDIACRRIEQAQRQGDLLRDMPPAEDPADARMADMFSGDAG